MKGAEVPLSDARPAGGGQKAVIRQPLPSTAVSQGFWALGIWLLGQCVALGIAGLRVPMSARYPLYSEAFAIHVMVVTQVALGALLGPILLNSGRTTLLTVISGAGFVQLAGVMSQTPVGTSFIVSIYVALWLGGMWRTLSTLPPRLRPAAAGAFSMLALLAPVIIYLGEETGEKNLAYRAALQLPIPAALRLLDVNQWETMTWVVVLLAGIPGIFLLWRRRGHKK